MTKPIRGGRNGNATYLPAPAVTLHVYNAVNQAAEQEGITKHRKMVQILEKWATGYLRKSR